MRQLSRFLALTRLERRVLLKAVFLLGLIQIGLGRVPFTVLRRIAIPGAADTDKSPAGSLQYAETVAWAVLAASRRVPGPTTCLSRAMTVQAMLARAGCASRLQVGVSRGPQGEIDGHAWVECHGRIVIGGTPAEIGQFTRLAAFDVESTLQLRALITPQAGR